MSISTLSSESEQQDIEKSRTKPISPSDGIGTLMIMEKDPEKGVEALRNPSLISLQPGYPVERTVTAQDWTSPDDPENPMNWLRWKKVYHTIIPGLFAFIVTFASSVYTPGYPEVMIRFHVSSTVALLGLSLYVLGLAFGPVLAAPISETFGRRVVYLTSLPLAALFSLGAGLSQNFASLIICRFWAGFFGSPVLAVGAGTNADIWPPIFRAVSTSSFLLAPFLGPALGPAVGGFAAQYKGWRWTQWPILFILLPSWIFSLGMKETYKKIILNKRAKRLGIPPPLKTTPSGVAGIRFLLTVTLARPINMIFTEPIVFFFSLYTGFNFSVLFAFFDAFPLVFQGVYHFSPGFSGLTFLGIGFGVVLGAVTVIVVDRFTFRKQHNKSHKEGRGGVVAPEHRLYAAMMGSFGLPIGLFWFAWSARQDVHWISPVLATVPFAWGNICVFCAAALYLVDTYGPMNGASALAANGLVRYISGAAFPLFTIQMYKTLSIPWATSLLGFLSLFMLPIPWILFRYGPAIRKQSRFDTAMA